VVESAKFVESASRTQDSQPQRVVVLGASNVTRSIGAIYEALSSRFADDPLELLAAHGHGRSYGTETSVLGRRLPSIRDCGLWKALAERENRPAKVLLTDLGNDLIYGQPVETLLAWVRECLDRLQRTENEIIATQLPVVNFGRITRRKFAVMKTVFFPSCDIDLAKILSRAEKFSALLEKETQSRKIRLIEPQAAWYGWDPIHVRRGCWPEVWPLLLDFSREKNCDRAPRCLSFWQKLKIKFLAPENRVLFGRAQRKSQPVAKFRDGSTISFY
jgi:hypothetical protein